MAPRVIQRRRGVIHRGCRGSEVKVAEVKWRSYGEGAGFGGRALRPLHHCLALLSLQQLVVLEQALVPWHTMGSVWERQQTCNAPAIQTVVTLFRTFFLFL